MFVYLSKGSAGLCLSRTFLLNCVSETKKLIAQCNPQISMIIFQFAIFCVSLSFFLCAEKLTAKLNGERVSVSSNCVLMKPHISDAILWWWRHFEPEFVQWWSVDWAVALRSNCTVVLAIRCCHTSTLFKHQINNKNQEKHISVENLFDMYFDVWYS